MFHILHQYLIQHKSLSLPGLGTIELQNIPAISNFSDHMIEPPMQKTIFDDMHDAPDKDLFQYIASRLQIEEWEAIKRVNDFSYELKNKLKEGDEIVWDKVGVLRSDLSGSVTLEAKTITYDFMEPVAAKRIIRVNANHTILRGDTEVSGSFIQHQLIRDDAGVPVEAGTEQKKWWIWACALGGTALLLLFLHFYKTGFPPNSLHNTQKTAAKEAPATYLQAE
ncbi:hypothetical protein [Agriterribacter sp.]|uniref:hypothetical protein n=1 Tax=Agriterribacter sp. TaxID=2821509 RepID=UPI002CD66036|nr:hypothetical protein [Agriterribacter sp.]HRP56582.1 hypothetical protein [Agriterribacter sp.]